MEIRKWPLLKYFRTLSLILVFYVLTAGCSNNDKDKIEWFKSKNQAIQQGLSNEDLKKDDILSVESIAGETFIFINHLNTLRVATLSKNKQGFRWYRSTQDLGFVNKVGDYSVSSVIIETEDGKKFKLFAGRTFDKRIKEMCVKGEGQEKILKVDQNSGLFYTIATTAKSNITITSCPR